MKLGFIGLNEPENAEKDAAFAAQHGLQGLEFNFWDDFADVTDEHLRQLKEAMEPHGIECAALGLWNWNHISPDDAERKESLTQLSRAIDAAAALGSEVLLTGAGELPDADAETNAKEFADVFPPYVEQAREAGIKLALYPLHGKSFLQGLEDYRLIWEHVPEVGIKLDPANFHRAGRDYLRVLHEAGDRVYHVHVKEHLNMDGEVVAQPAAGMGDVQWGKVMAFLYEHEYEGYLSVEPHGPVWDVPGKRHKCVRLSARHIRQFLL